MDLTFADADQAVATRVAAVDVVVPVGSRTHHEELVDRCQRNGSAGSCRDRDVRPRRAGRHGRRPAATVEVLSAALGAAGSQECALRSRARSVRPLAAALASGLSSPRRLRYGPLSDRVLEVRIYANAEGAFVRWWTNGQEHHRVRHATCCSSGSFGTLCAFSLG